MNNAQIRQYWREYELTRQRIVKKYAPGIYRAIYSQIVQFDKEAKIDLEIARGRINVIISADAVKQAIKPIYTFAGATYARNRHRVFLKLIKKDFIDWRSVLEMFFEQIAGRKITQIVETTRNWINKTIDKGLQDGLGYEEISKHLLDKDISKRRARMIARTEGQGALNRASMEAASRTDLVLNKMWISALDKRTRHKPKDKADHRVLHKQVVAYGEPFSNGLMQPGDPSVNKPEEVINCRCTVAFIPVE